jgi:hypothetical protein
MKTKLFISLFCLMIIFVSFTHPYLAKNSVNKNLSDSCTNSLYNNAYNELSAMLLGDEPLSFKRAVFITENALNKYGYDDFVLKCCDTGLKYFPKSINLLVEKTNYYQKMLKAELKENGHIYNTTRVQDLHLQCALLYSKIDSTGYENESPEVYNAWVDSLHAEEKRRSIPLTDEKKK